MANVRLFSFFLAEIQIQKILEQVSIRDIRTTLEKLPQRPEAIIHQAFDIVMSQQESLRTLACTCLVWIANAQKAVFV